MLGDSDIQDSRRVAQNCAALQPNFSYRTVIVKRVRRARVGLFTARIYPHPTKGCTLVQFLAPESTSSRGLPGYPRNAFACNCDA